MTATCPVNGTAMTATCPVYGTEMQPGHSRSMRGRGSNAVDWTGRECATIPFKFPLGGTISTSFLQLTRFLGVLCPKWTSDICGLSRTDPQQAPLSSPPRAATAGYALMAQAFRGGLRGSGGLRQADPVQVLGVQVLHCAPRPTALEV